MAKRRIAVIVFVLCLCFGLVPGYVHAASTTDAYEPIDKNQDCVLTLSFAHEEMTFEDVSVELFRIADVSSDFRYTLTYTFAPTNLILNGIQSNREWNVIRTTLEAYIRADNIKADRNAKSDSNGQVCFEALEVGLYLAVVGDVVQGEEIYIFDSALVALPGQDVDGNWQYQVTVSSKSERIPPIESDEKKELKVLKLWKGDEGKNNRPKSVEVEIFCNGISWEKIVLSQENNWSYSWETKEINAKWMVIERNTSSEYTMTVEERDASFIITNTLTTKEPDDSTQTGDTTNIMLYIVLMFLSGGLLIILGITGKKNAYEEEK